jgi:transposase
MKRFIEGADRRQVTLLPECLDDYIAEDSPVRVVDAFVYELDLWELGFESAEPAATGRPSYHLAVLLKIYIYGYLNRIQSSRRLEREAQRVVAVDGSKFKAVNNRDRNFTPRKLEARMQQIDESIERYLSALDTADRTEPIGLEAKATRLQDKLVKLREQMRELRSIETKLHKQPTSNFH